MYRVQWLQSLSLSLPCLHCGLLLPASMIVCFYYCIITPMTDSIRQKSFTPVYFRFESIENRFHD